ncbi:hypothetical protein [Fluviicola taffensis]|uniref:Uncharacterized protein n=1 Tax=Fluviicola taffensis (strain DSM 16823 / NCIMB 13979 / RW262) TaxID=755732 RepID=F2IGI8_FLUTR|nr:hypothetical protein [Fluviicola taffensis]AEA42594.1 hypothetical protein Fluta_0590 [Fluviicola taffensis DSM 16823]
MLVIGTKYLDVLFETFLDPETSHIRVRPLSDQGFPPNILIESLTKFRDEYPEGTVFRTESVTVCKRPEGRIYLRAKNQMLYEI